jgi:hypothetical protein
MEAWRIARPNAPPPPDYSITFDNWSQGTFQLSDWGLDTNLWDVILQQPSDSMPTNWSQTLSWYIRQAGTVLMPTDYHFGSMLWRISANGRLYSFGIAIENPVQFWGIGKAPRYLVTDINGAWSSERHYGDSCVIPMPSDFPYKISVSAVAGHSSIFVTANIDDKP